MNDHSLDKKRSLRQAQRPNSVTICRPENRLCRFGERIPRSSTGGWAYRSHLEINL